MFTLLLPQVQPFFNSCLNDCLRHAVTVFCPDIPKTSGRRETVVVGIYGVSVDEVVHGERS